METVLMRLLYAFRLHGAELKPGRFELKRCQKWSVFKTLQFQLSCKRSSNLVRNWLALEE